MERELSLEEENSVNKESAERVKIIICQVNKNGECFLHVMLYEQHFVNSVEFVFMNKSLFSPSSVLVSNPPFSVCFVIPSVVVDDLKVSVFVSFVEDAVVHSSQRSEFVHVLNFHEYVVCSEYEIPLIKKCGFLSLRSNSEENIAETMLENKESKKEDKEKHGRRKSKGLDNFGQNIDSPTTEPKKNNNTKTFLKLFSKNFLKKKEKI